MTDDLARLVAGEHHDPHGVLGAHPVDGGVVVRAFRPGAISMRLIPELGPALEMERAHRADGVFEVFVPGQKVPFAHRLEATWDGGTSFAYDDPYSFLPTLGELDLHLISEGRHEQLYDVLGAHERELNGIAGTSFAVWAPSARAVGVAGDFNLWNALVHPMRSL
ncbi:MAG TPA: hypothetical protein VGM80_15680, partial [Gaiellaceae bacterium]